jgi:hypothetical protein
MKDRLMRMIESKGQAGPGQVVTLIIVIAIIIVLVIIITVLSGKGDVIMAGINNMFRFG